MEFVNENALEDLECTKCKGSLRLVDNDKKIECINCKKAFSIKDGICNFLDDDHPNNVKNQIDYYDAKARKALSNPDLYTYGFEKIGRRQLIKPFERLGISLKGLKGKKILQVGAGEAAQCCYFYDYGAKMYAFDVSPGMASVGNILSKHRGYKVDIFVADAEKKYPFKDNSFDIVFTNSVLNHIKDNKREAYVSENTRVVKQGGVVLDIVPNPENYHWNTKTYKDLMCKDGVEEFLSVGKKDILVHLYKKAGLEDVVFWSFERVKARYDEGKKFLTVLEQIIYKLFRIKSKCYPHFLFQTLALDIEAYMDDHNILSPLLYEVPRYQMIAGWKKKTK